MHIICVRHVDIMEADKCTIPSLDYLIVPEAGDISKQTIKQIVIESRGNVLKLLG